MRSLCLALLLLCLFSTACRERRRASYPIGNNVHAQYKPYYRAYTREELHTELTDTLSTEYRPESKELDSFLMAHWDDESVLFPTHSFDGASFRKLPSGEPQGLKQEEVVELLAFINEPLNYNWTEKPFTPMGEIVFKGGNDAVVGKVTVGEGFASIETDPGPPQWLLARQGSLTPEAAQKLKELFLKWGME